MHARVGTLGSREIVNELIEALEATSREAIGCESSRGTAECGSLS